MWHLAEESNPAQRFWRPPHYRCASQVYIIKLDTLGVLDS